MLLAATAIFLYYTAWTLLMVCISGTRYISIASNSSHMIALCRPGSPSPRPLSSACLGHSHPRHPGPPGVRRGGHFHRHCDDQQQQEEGRQGQGCGKEEDLKGIRRIDATTGPRALYHHLCIPRERADRHRDSSRLIGKIIKLNQVAVPVQRALLRASKYALRRALGK